MERQQNLNVKGESDKEKYEEDEEAGANHMQIEKLMEDRDSSSSDLAYLVNYGDFQFQQGAVMKPKYSTTAKTMSKSEIKRKYMVMQDT